MHYKPEARGGFTLIELMIVVAIIGILASIAVPNFLAFQLRARRSEAFVNLRGIVTAEVAYFHLYDAWVECETSPDTPLDRKAYPFDMSKVGWEELGWAPDGEVRCHYRVQAFSNSNGEWIRPTVTCDLDNDNLIATYYMDLDPLGTSGSSRHMELRGNGPTSSEARY